MRRNIKGLCKFLLLGIVTIFTTVFIFRQVRPPKDSNTDYHNVRGINPIPPPAKLVRNKELDRQSDSRQEQSELEVKQSINLVTDPNLKINWHNYEQIEEDKARKGKIFIC